MEKKIYDLRVNSRNSAEPMTDGFFKKTEELVSTYNEGEYRIIECDKCFYRVNKRDIEDGGKSSHSKTILAYLKKAGAQID